jgi:hypothetical protein
VEKSPIIFGNSFPKSGSHLLAQVLLAFPQIGLAVDRGMGPVLTYEPTSGRKRTTSEILNDLNQFAPADVGFGHIVTAPEIIERWCHPRVAHYFIYRDPRDVVVSHAYFIADKAMDHVHHQYYLELPLEERIRVSITGRPDWEGDFPDIRGRYELYTGWLDCDWICPIRFDDMIVKRDETLEKILDYVEERGFQRYTPRQEALVELSKAVDPKQSFTFRSGKVGDWRNHFTNEHKRLFKDTSGDLLIRLGYEDDNDW